MNKASTGLVLVGGGSSRRMGGQDKVWTCVAGRPLLWYSLHTLYPLVDACVLVVRSDRRDQAEELRAEFPALIVTIGGQERRNSVANGLKALPEVSLVAVHDAARPLVPASLLHVGVSLAIVNGGAIPVVPLADTIKRLGESGRVVGTVDRDSLRAAQTPQVFRATDLRQAHERHEDDGEVTDDASLFAAGGTDRLVVFDGSALNFKVTTQFDLLLARLLIEGGYWCG